MTEKTEQALVKDINIIKNLLAQLLINGRNQTESIKTLSAAGLEPKDIAEAIGTTSNTVRVSLSNQRKKTK